MSADPDFLAASIEALTFKMPSKIVADDILFIINNNKENKTWRCMWIVCLDRRVNWNAVLVSLEKKNYKKENFKMSSATVVIGALRVNTHVLPTWYYPNHPSFRI